jgi:hypothetical protein
LLLPFVREGWEGFFISPLQKGGKIKEAREGWEATNLRFSFAPSLRKGRLGRVFHLSPVSPLLSRRGKIKETMGRGLFKNLPPVLRMQGESL